MPTLQTRASLWLQVTFALLAFARQLVDARRVLQQRLHDQLNALCPAA